MSEGKRTWKYGNVVITEDQVSIVDADWYIRKYLVVLGEFFKAMGDRGDFLFEFMEVSGRMGEMMTDEVNDKMCAVFDKLALKGQELFVVLATKDTPGIPAGALIDTFIKGQQEVLR